MLIRTAAVVLALTFAGTAAFAQSATTPDPLVLPQKGGNSDEVVVPGSVERPVELPNGDVRSTRQRARDRARFDRCVQHVTDRESESPGANPVASSPEEYCSSRLGMRDRNAAPERRTRNQ
jgi:hypothetical protein